MSLERITDGAPRFVVLPEAAIAKIQFDEAFVFSESARNCKEFSITNLEVAENSWFETLQTTVSAQPIRENQQICQGGSVDQCNIKTTAFI
jgi:hypothetical protein